MINPSDLCEWLKAKNSNDGPIIGVGLPCYSLFQNLLYSIESGSVGLIMIDGIEVTTLNTPVQIVGLVLSARNGPKGTNT